MKRVKSKQFQDLIIWQKAYQFVLAVAILTSGFWLLLRDTG